MASISFPKHIFKAYDIRGLVDGDLSRDLAYHIGRAFACYLRNHGYDIQQKKIVVGRDMRESSDSFTIDVVRGIKDEGGHVVNIGLSTTPLFNFACAHYEDHVGGIMVTASHNPAEYNGFKMTLGDGLPIGKTNGMEEIYNLVCTIDPNQKLSGGSEELLDVLPVYLDRILSLVPVTSIRPLNVVIDYGNGMGSVTFTKLCERLPITVTSLYEKPDGHFPNHEANPLKVETLRDLEAKVSECGADFGFALDGDADRIGLVDNTGIVVDASIVGLLVGREVLAKHPGALMLYDLRSSQIVPEVLTGMGASTEMCMVGHALIKKMMKEKKAAFASELSLHLYFGDMYDVESSDLAFLYILQLLSREQKLLSTIITPLQKYVHSGEINFTVTDKAATIARVREVFLPQVIREEHIDGLWMQFDWGWLSVRESNTEPVLRLNLETNSSILTAQKVAEVKSLIEQ